MNIYMQKLQNYQVNMDKVMEMHRYTTQLSDLFDRILWTAQPTHAFDEDAYQDAYPTRLHRMHEFTMVWR